MRCIQPPLFRREQAPALRYATARTVCFACISLQNMRPQNCNHNCQGEDVFVSVILFLYPFSSPFPLYHKSAEKTSSLPKLCAFKFSVKNNREKGLFLLFLRCYSCAVFIAFLSSGKNLMIFPLGFASHCHKKMNIFHFFGNNKNSSYRQGQKGLFL